VRISHVPGLHVEAPAIVVRRQLVVGGAWLLGTGLLGTSLSRQPGSPQFYGLTAAAAATWTAGGLLSGPLNPGSHQGTVRALHRPIGTPAAAGVAAFTVFAGCALAARKIPALDRAIGNVLAFTGEGSTPVILATTLANGIGRSAGTSPHPPDLVDPHGVLSPAPASSRPPRTPDPAAGSGLRCAVWVTGSWGTSREHGGACGDSNRTL
jgi:hypothetical protein